MTAIPDRARRLGESALVLLLLAAHASLLVDQACRNWVAVDEAGHLAAGLYHWQTGRYDMYVVNPPLPRMLAVLPALADPAVPSVVPHSLFGSRGEFVTARAHASACGPAYLRFVRLSRLAGIAWSLLGAWLVYRWSRRLHGPAGGLVSLSLWCFSPNVLANAGMVTPDLPAAVAGLAATFAFWHHLRAGGWPEAVLAGLLLGVALLCKGTLLVLLGVWAALWLAWRFSSRPDARPRLAHALAVVGIGFLVLNLGYAFDQTGRRLGDFRFDSRILADQPGGNRFRDSPLGPIPLPVPADYVRGIDLQRVDFEAKFYSYLAGEWRTVGWWHYYLVGLALKVPLPTWALLLICAALLVARRPPTCSWRDDLALLLPIGAVLTLVSSQTGFNHHLRYILPLFPFAIVFAGRAGWLFTAPSPWGWAGWAVPLLVLASAAAALRVHPHHLSYFNELAGGPDNGHDYLVDSNIDWGQDLLFLKRWLDDHPEARPLGLAHYNFVDPGVAGLGEFYLPAPSLAPAGASREQLLAAGPQPGHFALDVNFVRGAPFFASDGKGNLDLIAQGTYTYFQRFRPVAKAGYSIFIYHITLEQANAVRRDMGLPLLPPTK
ncbi:MAG: ArnT family glycosyltransferase [Gemmataceae bacterium]